MMRRDHRSKVPPAARAAAVLALASILAALPAAAEEPQLGTLQLVDTRPIGMGGALRATPGSTSGIYLNPATLAMARVYHLGARYQYTGQEELHTAGASVVDSVTSRYIAAGLSLDYRRADRRRTDFESWDARLALAGNIGDTFFIGMTGRYIRVERDLEEANRGPNGVPALPASGSQQLDGLTFDAGAALRIAEVFSLGLVGYNLSDTGSVYAPIQLAPAAALTLFDMLIVESDVVLDFTRYEELNEEIHAGTEVFVGGIVPIRAGYSYDVHLDLHSVCAGLGYVDRQFAVDFGFRQEVAKRGRMVLSFGLRIFLQ
ncbi:MAG: hypothetical protein R6V85_02280 [Polyangia bacterium]